MLQCLELWLIPIGQARICRNLRYSLGHLKVGPSLPSMSQARDKTTYLAILDSIVMGPSPVSAAEAEALLSINTYLFRKSEVRRTELIATGERPAWWADGWAGLGTIWEHQVHMSGVRASGDNCHQAI